MSIVHMNLDQYVNAFGLEKKAVTPFQFFHKANTRAH